MSSRKSIVLTWSFTLAVLLFSGQSARAGMVQGFQMSGNLGYELAGLAEPGGPGVFPFPPDPVSGTIALSNIPPGATIQQVFLYTNDFAGAGIGGGSLDFSFGFGGPATPVGSSFPTSQDPTLAPGAFGYEVSLLPTSVLGNGSYSVNIVESPAISFGNSNQLAGAGLLVIYSFPLLPVSTITVNHGALLLGTGNPPAGANTTWAETAATIPAGIGNMSILTFADDPANSGETILFNGNNVGGPLNSNLPGGGSGSVLNFSNLATLGGGNDQVSVTSTGDIFSWHVAVLQSRVPEPNSALLLALLGVNVLLKRRRMAWRC
jgi:hypothetical protein